MMQAQMAAPAPSAESADLASRSQLSLQALTHNAQAVEHVRGLMSIFSGAAAGVLGATGILQVGGKGGGWEGGGREGNRHSAGRRKGRRLGGGREGGQEEGRSTHTRRWPLQSSVCLFASRLSCALSPVHGSLRVLTRPQPFHSITQGRVGLPRLLPAHVPGPAAQDEFDRGRLHVLPD